MSAWFKAHSSVCSLSSPTGSGRRDNGGNWYPRPWSLAWLSVTEIGSGFGESKIFKFRCALFSSFIMSPSDLLNAWPDKSSFWLSTGDWEDVGSVTAASGRWSSASTGFCSGSSITGSAFIESSTEESVSGANSSVSLLELLSSSCGLLSVSVTETSSASDLTCSNSSSSIWWSGAWTSSLEFEVSDSSLDEGTDSSWCSATSFSFFSRELSAKPDSTGSGSAWDETCSSFCGSSSTADSGVKWSRSTASDELTASSNNR